MGTEEERDGGEWTRKVHAWIDIAGIGTIGQDIEVPDYCFDDDDNIIEEDVIEFVEDWFQDDLRFRYGARPVTEGEPDRKVVLDAHQIKDFMNALHVLNPSAIDRLVSTRVLCNQRLAAHPTVQVLQSGVGEHKAFHVGFMGIINGLLGKIGYHLTALYPEDGSCSKLLGFSLRILDSEEDDGGNPA